MQAILTNALLPAADPITTIFAGVDTCFDLAESTVDEAALRLFLRIDGCIQTCLTELDLHCGSMASLTGSLNETSDPSLTLVCTKVGVRRRLDLVLGALTDLARRDPGRSACLLNRLTRGVDDVRKALDLLSDWWANDDSIDILVFN